MQVLKQSQNSKKWKLIVPLNWSVCMCMERNGTDILHSLISVDSSHLSLQFCGGFCFCFCFCFFEESTAMCTLPGVPTTDQQRAVGGCISKEPGFPPIQRRAQQVSSLSAHNLNWPLQKGNRGERTSADAELFFSCHFGQKNDRLSG